MKRRNDWITVLDSGRCRLIVIRRIDSLYFLYEVVFPRTKHNHLYG